MPLCYCMPLWPLKGMPFWAQSQHCKEDTLELIEMCRAAFQWAGYIKDYDGGTLMECILHEVIPYTRLPNVIEAQRRALDDRIRGFSNSHVVHAGLEHFHNHPDASLPIDDVPGKLLHILQ